MKRKSARRVLAILLTLVMIFSAVPATVVSAVGEFTAPKGMYTISNTKRQIAPGVTENKLVTNKTSGNEQVQSYAVTVDMSEKYDNTLAVGYADYQGTEWKLQTVRNQAAAFEKKTGKNVVAAMNADIYNMQTGEPTNSLVMGGIVYKARLGSPYFAILKDGTPKIGSSLTKDVLDNARECVGGFYTLVENGDLTSNANNDYFAPRIAVGIKANGDVILFAADGRNAPVSVGLNNIDTANMMLGLGCVDVLNLDGGGSATYAAQYEGSNSLVVANRPSDGVERSVASSLFVVSNAKPTGEFDHASLQPNDLLYTPGAEVDFTAAGVDGAGGSAPLPADGKFALADNSFGTITADGKFVSSGKTGAVVVNYVSNGAVCGSTSIEIVVPDELFVGSNEQAVGPGVTTDFGIVAKCKDRDVILRDNDIVWSITDSESGADLNGKAGTFSGLTFTGAEDGAYNAKVVGYFNSNSSAKAEITVFVGSKQVKLFDFEYTDDKELADSDDSLKYIPSMSLPVDPRGGVAGGYYNQGYPLYVWPNAAISESAAGTIVSKADGEPVRFGDHSLRIDFDYSTYNGNGNANVYIRQTDPDYAFEGSPTAIGCWVYIPEGTGPYLVYLNCANNCDDPENGFNLAYNTVYKIDGSKPGWRYLEMDLTGTKSTSGQGIGNSYYPYGYYQGCGIFWISYQKATMGDRTSEDSIYLDDVFLIYGANTNDTTNPEVLYVGDATNQIEDGVTVFNSNVNTLKASYQDVQEKYMSGIDNSKTKMYIDGIDVTDKCYVNENDNEIYFYDAYLANGTHCLEVEVSDNNDNRTTEMRYFKVDAPEIEQKDTVVELESVNGAPVIGRDYELAVTTNNPEDLLSAEITVKVLSSFTRYWRDVEVVPADGFKFDGDPVYKKSNDTLTFKLVRDNEKSRSILSTTIAKIITHVPLDIPDFLSVTHRISKGVLEFASEKNKNYVVGFSGRIEATCEAGLQVSADPMVVGTSGGNIYVKDVEGRPVEGAQVYSSDKLLGVTDADGKLFTNEFVSGLAEFVVHAEKDGALSFKLNSQSLNAGGSQDGAPTYIKLGITETPESAQSITWMSSPSASADKAVVLFTQKDSYKSDSDLIEFVGESNVQEFISTSSLAQKYAARINRATLTGLKADTEYVYKVGDGEKMSELKSFKTTAKGAPTNFFVIGDTQANDTSITDKISASLTNSGKHYDFGVQTGDFVDNGGNYIMWENIAKIFSGGFFGSHSMLQVLGNHEYYGDSNGTNAGLYFNLPGATVDGAPEYYSTQYGNVYVAVINYGLNTSYEKAAEWIKADAAKSDAQWKILTVHQPAYTTNPSGTSLETMRIFRNLCDEAGIDVMFSGHDHSYARTKPMTGGKVNEEGTTYYICGSTGEKSYDIIKNDNYNFDCLDGEYNAIFLTVSTTDTKLEITTYDQNGDQANIIDTFTKTKEVKCTENGHKPVFKDGKLYCSICNYPDIKDYTGFAANADNNALMYFIQGEAKTGWMTIGEDAYYFDENGCAVTGENLTIDGIGGYNFDKDGKQIDAAFVKGEDGVTKAYRGGQLLKGWWTDSNGDIYYFSTRDGAMRTGKTEIKLRTNQILEVEFSQDGKLIRGCLYKMEDGTVYYWGSEMVSGWQEIDGNKYYFDPDTHFMATGNQTIDGKEYGFSQYGILQHEGFHTYDENWDVIIKEPNCVNEGKVVHICKDCYTPIEEVIPALGHVDKDGDGKCDRCQNTTDYEGTSIDSFFHNIFARVIAIYKAIIKLIQNNFNVFDKNFGQYIK